MKLHVLISLLCISNQALPQATTGNLQWKYANGVSYTYTGETLNNKPSGIGYAVSGNDSIIFGFFSVGDLSGRVVKLHKDGGIIIKEYNNNGIAEGAAVEKDKNDALFVGIATKGYYEGKGRTIMGNKTMVITNHYRGNMYGRFLVVPGDWSSLYDLLLNPGSNRMYGYKYDSETDLTYSGLWENYKLVDRSYPPFTSFIKGNTFHTSDVNGKLIISEDMSPYTRKIEDTCFVNNRITNEAQFGDFVSGGMVWGMMMSKNTRMIGQVKDKKWTGECTMFEPGKSLSTGRHENDVLNGHGVLVSIPDKGIYIGEFHEGVIHGRGAMLTNNIIRQGYFRNGALDGDGKIILADGKKIEGQFSEGNLIKLKTVTGEYIPVRPGGFNEAIGFLLKECENNFVRIILDNHINPSVKSDTWASTAKDCIFQIPGYEERRWILPDQKGKDGKLRNEFVFAVSEKPISSVDSVYKQYNEIFSKLKACELTNLAPGKKLKLSRPVNGKLPANLNFKKFECLFTVPAYPGKKADPVIRLMVENLNGESFITVTIKSK